MKDKDSALSKLKASIAEVDGEVGPDVDSGSADDQAKDAKVTSAMSKVAKQQQQKLEEKDAREVKQKRIEQEAIDDDITQRIKTRNIVQFQYYVDFASITVIGLVFFLTCLSGLLNGVSQKTLSIRAIVSVVIASTVVYICRAVIDKLFHAEREKEDEAEKNRTKEAREKKDQEINE
ncbi:MAG: hypothetical protein ACUZ8O_05075 [Candidatus Anammoxibacter sp.]